MEPLRLSLLVKVVLYFFEFYFLYVSFRLVLYSPQNTYVVLHGPCNEVTGKCLEGVQKIVMTELKKNENVREFVIELDKTVKPADQTGADKPKETGKHETLPSKKDGTPAHDNLKESGAGKVRAGHQVETGKKKELSTDFLQQSLATITDIMNQFEQNDSDFVRSSKAKRSVIDAVSCYGKLLDQRRKNKKRGFNAFISKIKRKDRR